MKPFAFPTVATHETFESGIMVEAEQAVRSAYAAGVCALWSGESGVGKTTTRDWLTERINSAFEPGNPNAFRARGFEVGRTPGEPRDVFLAVKALYRAVAGHVMDPGVSRGKPVEAVAEVVVEVVRRKRIGVVLIDEAQRLSDDALDGLITVYNLCHSQTAPQGRHPFSLVLIGMGTLPSRVRAKPSLARRVERWVDFRPLGRDETWDYLVAVHPCYANADKESSDMAEQLDLIYRLSHGCPGQVTSLVTRAKDVAKKLNMSLSAAALRIAHGAATQNLERICEKERHGWFPEQKR